MSGSLRHRASGNRLANYADHGPWTDPGDCVVHFVGLPASLPGLCGIVQGLLIHDHYGRRLYGAAPAHFDRHSRETRPVRERLRAFLAADPAPPSTARAPFERSVGTCRDFALMLCAMLRHGGVPARVRCGFARYFAPDRCEDHWLCEYWDAEEGRWARADAQLDDRHRRHLAIEWDPCDLLPDQFIASWRAWRMCRAGVADPELFGHGAATGLWFVRVNLARDLLALRKREVSPWDAWREAREVDRTLDAAALRQGDEIAALAEEAEKPSLRPAAGAGDETLPPSPPWRLDWNGDPRFR